jgi:PPK2 family polyphosphate:nucleotide phosphotransferase
MVFACASVRLYRLQEMDYRERFQVPAEGVRLRDADPGFKGLHESKSSARGEIKACQKRLGHLQALLSAQQEHSVLIVLQAMDAGGKDGTVRHVFGAFNPQGATVTAFKVPTPEERAHDFLWRVHPHAPARGQIAISNRSHYEDVLVPRVHGWIDKAEWTDRYARIRAFEHGLVASGTLILKFFLHISAAEQLSRFEARIADPRRNWKISESDYAERKLWDAYMQAFEDALNATSTSEAPWYVIPADHKWFRNLAVSHIVADAMDDLRLAFPPPSVDLEDIRRKYHQAVEAENA